MPFLRLIPDEHQPAHMSTPVTDQSPIGIQTPAGREKISPNTTRAGATNTKFLVLTPEPKSAEQTKPKPALAYNDVTVDKSGLRMEAEK
ncbi:hypothetical protein LTS15_001386 [Exophiala xenobiotica]|nr:hypothetical protein LTS15_001386 [Exophiala xenobiotica]